MQKQLLEYLWHDDNALRSKIKVSSNPTPIITLEDIPHWDTPFLNEAISTYQLMILKPVKLYPHPFHPDALLVLCECFTPEGDAMPFNHRSKLRHINQKGGSKLEMTLGFEQEYVVNKHKINMDEIKKQGTTELRKYYHGIGVVKERALAELHLVKSLEMGLSIQGVNCESIPNQWEFQCGQGHNELMDPIDVCDDKITSLWLLYRLAEQQSADICLDAKPYGPDWGGSGCHVNFETKDMRQQGGYEFCIQSIIPALEKNHRAHIDCYGRNNHLRLSGKFTTSPIDTFKVGDISEFSSSIRVPPQLKIKGRGYLEDRRPTANSDPYLVAARLMATLAGITWPWSEVAKDHGSWTD